MLVSVPVLPSMLSPLKMVSKVPWGVLPSAASMPDRAARTAPYCMAGVSVVGS